MKSRIHERRKSDQVTKASTGTRHGLNWMGLRAGMSPALLSSNMKLGVAILLSSLLFLPQARAGGGAEGGTNVDKATMELVEFQHAGKYVPINPREFDGLYRELEPTLRRLDHLVPGLRGQLETTLTEKSWFVTKKTFEPRNDRELKPIGQNEKSVFISADLYGHPKFGRQQRVEAFLHELVRGLVMKHHWSTGMQDQWVEKLTPLLYFDRDSTGSAIVNALNLMAGRNSSSWRQYATRAEMASWLVSHGVLRKYADLCQRTLGGKRNILRLSREEIAAVVSQLKDYDNVSEAIMPFLNVESQSKMTLALWGFLRLRIYAPDTSDAYQANLVVTTCKEMDEVMDSIRQIVYPAEPKLEPEGAKSLEEALRLLEQSDRSPDWAQAAVSDAQMKSLGQELATLTHREDGQLSASAAR